MKQTKFCLKEVILALIAALLLSACGTMRNAYYSDSEIDWQSKEISSDNKLIHTLYLIGDSGDLDDTIQNRNYVVDAVGDAIRKETVETTLSFLGDNIYPNGLPQKKDPEIKMAEKV